MQQGLVVFNEILNAGTRIELQEYDQQNADKENNKNKVTEPLSQHRMIVKELNYEICKTNNRG